MPSTFISVKSKSRVLEKFRRMQQHKRRKPIETLAAEMNPFITGVLNYYGKFWNRPPHIASSYVSHAWLSRKPKLAKELGISQF